MEKFTCSSRSGVIVAPEMTTSNCPEARSVKIVSNGLSTHSVSRPIREAISLMMSASYPTTSPPSRDSKGAYGMSVPTLRIPSSSVVI
jgi:hypothetical protein